MAFRFINQLPQFLNASGEVLSGGQLAFYQSGTTTPQATYTDDTLANANPNPLQLDSTGRPTADIWMSGTYRVVLQDSTGATIWTRDDVEQPGGTTFSLPSLIAGQFLSNDGTNPLWAAILQVPSPAGANGKVLGTDGTNLFWQAAPTNGSNGAPGTNANITLGANSIKMNNGTGNFWLVQWGSASAPASGIPSTSQAITFPTAYMAAPNFVKITVTGNSFATNGKLVIDAVTVKSATGFTVGFDTNTTTDNIFGSVPFDWIAFGAVAS